MAVNNASPVFALRENGRGKAVRHLSGYEKETIVNFNEAEDIAYIFTYNKAWQRHLEQKLGLKPVMDNGSGGKEYQVDKRRIPMPRAPVKLSAEARRKKAEVLATNRLVAPKSR